MICEKAQSRFKEILSILSLMPTFREDTTWFPSKWRLKKIASANHKHCPDLGSDTSSVWNFCAHSSDIILRGNVWWGHEMSAAFSGWGKLCGKFFDQKVENLLLVSKRTIAFKWREANSKQTKRKKAGDDVSYWKAKEWKCKANSSGKSLLSLIVCF